MFVREFLSVVHRSLTSQFLRLQSLLITDCDPDLVELLREYGNEFSNRLLEQQIPPTMVKPTYQSSQFEREQYITKKYVNREFLSRSQYSNKSQEELNEILYENVETSNCAKTLHLLMLGANPNYSPKTFTVADHARRHQQWRQMKLIVANGGKTTSQLKSQRFFNYCLRLFIIDFRRSFIDLDIDYLEIND